MKILLLVALIFSDGDGAFVGFQFPTPEECFKGQAVMVEKIAAHNTNQPIKVTEYSMACVETKKAPQGQKS